MEWHSKILTNVCLRKTLSMTIPVDVEIQTGKFSHDPPLNEKLQKNIYL